MDGRVCVVRNMWMRMSNYEYLSDEWVSKRNNEYNVNECMKMRVIVNIVWTRVSVNVEWMSGRKREWL